MKDIELPRELFSIKDIQALYPNDVGITITFKTYVNQVNLRASKQVGVPTIVVPGMTPRRIKVSFFKPQVLLDSFEEYYNTYTYKLTIEKKTNMGIIINMLKAKIEWLKQETEISYVDFYNEYIK